jgi:cobalt-zinc-cadmium efflux system protein
MHVHVPRTTAVLRLALWLTLAYIVVLTVAGLRANSLALLSEAGHNLSDFFALLLSLVAVYLQGRAPDSSRTYGYGRAGVLAAFVNGGALVLLSFYIFYEAAHRLLVPHTVQAPLMMIVAAVGVAMNGFISYLLWKEGSDVNLRSSLLHMLGDTLSTAAVIIGGWAILLTGQNWIDPALSAGIAVMILWSSFGIIRETLNILLEGTPRGMRLEQIAQEICAVAGVNEVHDLHVWSLGSESHALSCHIGIADQPLSESDAILRTVQQRLAARFHIHHTTIQLEHAECEVAHGCVAPAGQAHQHQH